MSITSFDHFIETLENVPTELHRNFNLMCDLDRRSGEILRRINTCVRDYRTTTRKEERGNIYKESMELFDKAKSFAHDKVELALQTYDLVDRHIRRLETLGGNAILNITQQDDEKKNEEDLNNNNNHSANNTSGANSKKKNANKSNLDRVKNSETETKLAEPLSVDMPLDPNEPKYCTCHQVSFGEMIACDNVDCPIEWFHFACVDLKKQPKGKWYCPECFNINKKKKHKLKRQKV